MKRTPTTLFLAYAIVLSSFGPTARAQSSLTAETKAKAEVVDRLNKKQTRVKVKLRSGSEVKGRITQSGENSFALTDEKTPSASDIAYTDVVNVEGREFLRPSSPMLLRIFGNRISTTISGKVATKRHVSKY
jgi:small nuclear ribonucleoprotein (snRNP)-like protein